jgi:hypothetical protein
MSSPALDADSALQQQQQQQQQQPPPLAIARAASGAGASAGAGASSGPSSSSNTPRGPAASPPPDERTFYFGSAEDRARIEAALRSRPDELPACRVEFDDLRAAPSMPGSQAPSNRASFSVTILWPRHFAALRRAMCGPEEAFMESMMRCAPWRASGGKSGSTFALTWDKRFVLKYLSQTELDMFSPKYFAYMADALLRDRPSMLVKVLGIFKVACARASGEKWERNVLLMPNLFYGREITRIYDLKGSLRNRYVKEQDRAEKRVLLDENFMEHTEGFSMPIYEQAKALMRLAIWNDTVFLTELEVVDYSVLVGIDERRRELVMGIIDYLHLYTWRKRAERDIKQLVGRERATVQSPKDYKTRFRMAMDRFFMVMPDCNSRLDRLLEIANIENPRRARVDRGRFDGTGNAAFFDSSPLDPVFARMRAGIDSSGGSAGGGAGAAEASGLASGASRGATAAASTAAAAAASSAAAAGQGPSGAGGAITRLDANWAELALQALLAQRSRDTLRAPSHDGGFAPTMA